MTNDTMVWYNITGLKNEPYYIPCWLRDADGKEYFAESYYYVLELADRGVKIREFASARLATNRFRIREEKYFFFPEEEIMGKWYDAPMYSGPENTKTLELCKQFVAGVIYDRTPFTPKYHEYP